MVEMPYKMARASIVTMGTSNKSQRRQERLAAVRGWLRRISDTGDPTSAIEPQVLSDAQKLAELLRDNEGDLEIRNALGWLHWFRYKAQREDEGHADLNAAVEMLTPGFLTGAGEAPESLMPLLADTATPYAARLLEQVLTFADPDLLSAAVDVWRRILHATPADHPSRPGYLSNFGIALQTRFEHTGHLTDLDEAVTALQTAVETTPADHPSRPRYLSNLGLALRVRFERTGNQTDLDQAVSVGRDAVEATTASHPERERYLANLGIALRSRFRCTGNEADLDQAIEAAQAALKTIPTEHPDRAGHLSNLGIALQARFELTGQLKDVNEAIKALQTAVEATPIGHPDGARYLSNLGIALRNRFSRAGNRTNLDEALAAFHTAVEATPTGHPDRAGRLSNLGGTLQARFELTGNPTDLDQAVSVGRDAVEAIPTDHPNRPRYLSNLGNSLRTRFERTGNQTDLNQSLAAFQTAVEAAPADHPVQAVVLSGLGDVLRARFDRIGNQADLDQAIAALQTAVEITPASHPDRAGRLSQLGMALQARFELTGNQKYLDQAIDAVQAAVEATPTDHPGRAAVLSNLGSSLLARFELTGIQEYLDQAIDAVQAAVEATPTDHPDRAGRLSNLGDTLHARFDRTGHLTDLDQAIAALQTAVEATPADHPNQAICLSNLGNALRTRFARTGNQANLDQAVIAHQTVVQAIPADHPNRPRYLSNLGIALQTRFALTGNLTDLERAVSVGQEAAEATPTGHPEKPRYLSNLGLALQARFERTGNQTDLGQAVSAVRDAVEATPTDHPDRAIYLSNLGLALQGQFHVTHQQGDLDSATFAYERAWELVSAAPSVRIRAARAAADLVAQSEAGRAANLLEAAVRLLPEVAPRQLDRSDQQYALGGFAGLAGDAAALVLADTRGLGEERAMRALRLLEAGRAVLLSQALDTRSDLTELNRQHPGLAARFVGLRDRLDRPPGAFNSVEWEEDADALAVGQERITHDRHRLAHDFDDLLAEIRALDGFASFALPPTAEELLAETGPGPVVVFNISRYRSDALLLTQDAITQCELPQLTEDTLIDTINSFHQALHAAMSSEDRTQRRQAQAALTRGLEWLWDTVAGPVLDSLDYRFQPAAGADWPRVWWEPGGLLGLLPLHAAGYHTDPANDPGRRTVMDRVVSAYTPTVRALHYARRRPPAPSAPGQALIVAMPTTPYLPGDGRLAHVGAEAEMLCNRLPNHVLLLEPAPAGDVTADASSSSPTKTDVLGHLPACSIAHFACHGTSDAADPSRSRLLLHDHATDPLTVASLAPVRLDQAQLAYLSACRTAALHTTELIDEAIHLTSAFQLAGFPHVIGTLWEIDDRIAVTIAETFYTHLQTSAGTLDTSKAAWALHQAVRTVRDGRDLPGQLDRTRVPFLWAAYVHAGA